MPERHLPPEVRLRLEAIARRYGVSPDYLLLVAVERLLSAERRREEAEMRRLEAHIRRYRALLDRIGAWP
ncbi:MAG: hypothetical protein RML47_02670 [Bacteroidota bacterium]|nr:hypothetical protein [Rhodothermia bacterium]MCS7155724.1 hypothetical protein [Bacteroidota bacterium]MDW8137141.1 hypothetical protein [Bacteroidota bacterium]MDW8284989.1 hypothetical protein [Bacteroidota bacterium]